jgi:hypothetical protein
MSLNKLKIEATYKSADTEEFLDRIFYRKVGYGMAVASKAMGLTPNVVTFISIIFGVTAGHLFYYQNTTMNLIGVLLLITAEAMDGADGQLARLTNNYSRFGRIFDGFVQGKNKDIDDLNEVKETYAKITWLRSPFKKFLLRVYINYRRQQNLLAKNVRSLYELVEQKFNGVVPSWLSEEYRKLNKPMIKYQNILTTNTRMIVLFITIFLGNVLHYFLFELIILNLLLGYFVIREEKIHGYLLSFAKTKKEQADA